jgi:hypothetical protein
MAQDDQLKPLETAPSVDYWSQQGGGEPPTPSTKRHPNDVQYSAEQQQELQDKGGQ